MEAISQFLRQLFYGPQPRCVQSREVAAGCSGRQVPLCEGK
jgi:hypothetical protein